jgi:hypothetical protein
MDLNTALADALLDRFDTEFPAGSFLKIYSGSPPGGDNSASGTLLCTITLPATPWAAASGTGSKAKSGVWADVGAAGAGAGTNAGYFRLVNAAGTKLLEGTITVTGGGGNATIDNISIATGQPVTVNSFTITL